MLIRRLPGKKYNPEIAKSPYKTGPFWLACPPNPTSQSGGALSFVYMFQIYQYDYWRGERDGPRSPRPQQALVGVLALLLLAVGAWPEPLLALSRDAAAVLPGGRG